MEALKSYLELIQTTVQAAITETLTKEVTDRQMTLTTPTITRRETQVAMLET